MNKFWTHLNVATLATVLFCFASCQNNQSLGLNAHNAAGTAQAALDDEEMDELVAKKDDDRHHKKKKKEKKKKKKRYNEKKKK